MFNENEEIIYEKKYLKYKHKYLLQKNIIGGSVLLKMPKQQQDELSIIISNKISITNKTKFKRIVKEIIYLIDNSFNMPIEEITENYFNVYYGTTHIFKISNFVNFPFKWPTIEIITDQFTGLFFP